MKLVAGRWDAPLESASGGSSSSPDTYGTTSASTRTSSQGIDMIDGQIAESPAPAAECHRASRRREPPAHSSSSRLLSAQVVNKSKSRRSHPAAKVWGSRSEEHTSELQ